MKTVTSKNSPAPVGLTLALLASILLPGAVRADEMPAMSVHDVARLRLVDEVEISPDGALEAYTLSCRGRRARAMTVRPGRSSGWPAAATRGRSSAAR